MLTLWAVAANHLSELWYCWQCVNLKTDPNSVISAFLYVDSVSDRGPYCDIWWGCHPRWSSKMIADYRIIDSQPSSSVSAERNLENQSCNLHITSSEAIHTIKFFNLKFFEFVIFLFYYYFKIVIQACIYFKWNTGNEVFPIFHRRTHSISKYFDKYNWII